MHALEENLLAAWTPADWSDLTVLVAVSGGADSVALSRALAAVRQPGPGRLIVAHFNHGLRPQAEEEETFVRLLSEQLQAPFVAGRPAQALTGAGADGLEAAARHARYEFLQRTAQAQGARYVATAHTADDQLETILHRVLRGTSLSGLAGMRRARPLGPAVTLIRPFLGVRRRDVEAYLRDLGQAYFEDDSNRDPRFTRNRLRHELLPQLRRDYNPQVDLALLRLARLAEESQQALAGAVAALVERSVTFSGQSIVVDCRPLGAEHPYLIREMLVTAWRRQGWPEQAMGFDEWQSLADMILDAGPAQRTAPGAIQAVRQGDKLVLAARNV